MNAPKKRKLREGRREGKKSMESGTEGQQALGISVSKSRGRGLVVGRGIHGFG